MLGKAYNEPLISLQTTPSRVLRQFSPSFDKNLKQFAFPATKRKKQGKINNER